MSACACERCRVMCEKPCWGTPDEIQRLIDAGFGDRLALDYWSGDETIYVLAPALKGHEGQEAPWTNWSQDGCTFWQDGLCQLHEMGLKPSEGAQTYACRPGEFIGRRTLVALWETRQDIVEEWLHGPCGFLRTE